MKKEIHLQFSGCSWNAIPVMCYVAFTTVVFVGNLAITYRTCTATPMIAICKVNERKNKAFGRGNFSRKRHISIYALIAAERPKGASSNIIRI